MKAVSRGILPFYIPLLVVPLPVTSLPALSLWLPQLLRF
jgi:TRAP-type C4-dicarboxylate transport system permease large subunit